MFEWSTWAFWEFLLQPLGGCGGSGSGFGGRSTTRWEFRCDHHGFVVVVCLVVVVVVAVVVLVDVHPCRVVRQHHHDHWRACIVRSFWRRNDRLHTLRRCHRSKLRVGTGWSNSPHWSRIVQRMPCSPRRFRLHPRFVPLLETTIVDHDFLTKTLSNLAKELGINIGIYFPVFYLKKNLFATWKCAISV